MRYIAITQPGGPEVLQLAEGPVPEPVADEVLIRVAAAGVNRPDLMQRAGLYPPPAGASPIPGLEVAGTIEAVGSAVTRWQVGDQVCALANGGGYAEFVAVPAGQCLPVPAGLSPVEAAALPETFFTVWHNVVERAGLKQGESLLVHGGSGGIGATAIQLGKALGARVFATAGSSDKCRFCHQLGAERVINYHEEDFVTALREVTDKVGVDVILDMVGGDYVSRNLRLAALEGRVVNIAFQRGARTEVDLMPLLVKRLTLMGSTLRPQSAEAKARMARGLEETVWPLLASGAMRPHIDRVFPLAEAAAAHRHLDSGAAIGKTVLQVAGKTGA
ncbi:MAG: NAD(P)H-quinone oxidoreductase [Spongiibacteraceae bacterium]|jgi:NADPH2:quinone reductase|nr:NAD(P)H-quinone oxidoreductase [Spongiibacteraceae bacterium]